jgi:hypothetical protein
VSRNRLQNRAWSVGTGQPRIAGVGTAHKSHGFDTRSTTPSAISNFLTHRIAGRIVIPHMDWVTFRGGNGFAVDHPAGWSAWVVDGPACIVASPDGQQLAVIQPLTGMAGVRATDVIRQMRFSTANLFASAQVTNVTTQGPRSAAGTATYRANNGTAGHAQLAYVGIDDAKGILYAVAAPAAAFASAEPTLARIIRSQLEPRPPAPPAAPAPKAAPAPPPAAPIQFGRFTDPQTATYTVDAPLGWQLNGGMHHPALGDRRAWFEATSTDGIYVLNDPDFPQTLCIGFGTSNGAVVPVGCGGFFIGLTPGAETAADCYLAGVGPRRLPGFRPVRRRTRPDIADPLRALVASQGCHIYPGGLVTAVETILERPRPGKSTLVASLVTTCLFTGQYSPLGSAFWNAGSALCVSTAAQAATADAVRTRMLNTMRWAPAAYRIAERDEAQITAIGQAGILAQWTWFDAQQRAHQFQQSIGDSIVNNYWAQQRANDSMLRGWERNQSIYDRLSQDRSDAMTDRQRLTDDNGRPYDAPAGSNYYWRDPNTGNVVGTLTEQPPDYLTNYAPLRKL